MNLGHRFNSDIVGMDNFSGVRLDLYQDMGEHLINLVVEFMNASTDQIQLANALKRNNFEIQSLEGTKKVGHRR